MNIKLAFIAYRNQLLGALEHTNKSLKETRKNIEQLERVKVALQDEGFTKRLEKLIDLKVLPSALNVDKEMFEFEEFKLAEQERIFKENNESVKRALARLDRELERRNISEKNMDDIGRDDIQDLKKEIIEMLEQL